jgi:formate hydrogenlyase transcriptional activator
VLRTEAPWTGRFADLRERGSERHPGARDLGFAVGCVLPLGRGDRTVGVLCLRRRTDTLYTDDDVDLLMRVAHQVTIGVANALAYGEVRRLKETLAEERVYLRDEVRSERNFEEIVGTSPVLRRALRDAETVAPTDPTVLIHGETGTGKELIARAIHNLSPRRPGAFVKLNCAAIPTGLLESELFGHEKGAFTGAIAQRIGRFELANGGTVFLDEVSEIPLDLQTKLLRVLQEREFERLGSGRTLRTDARLIAATNRELGALVDEQKFRADLFYRLNVFPVHVPPLRERPGDIPLLVRHFVEHYARRMKRSIETIPSATMEALTRYHWPGNIRELQNLMERAVILSPGPVLRVPLDGPQTGTAAGQRPGKAQTLAEAEHTLQFR